MTPRGIALLRAGPMLGRMKITRSGVGPEVALQPAASDWFNCLWTAATCWFMAWMFVRAWWWPRELDDGRWVRLGVGVLLLEFILIHSGAFFNNLMTQKSGWARNKAVIGLTTLYLGYGLAIAFVFRSWWILGTFALVMSGRLWAVFTGEQEIDRAISQRRVAASAMLFLGLTFATVFVPVPRGGLTPELLNEVWPARKGGLWERSPERALAMGVVYFFLLGLVEARPPRK